MRRSFGEHEVEIPSSSVFRSWLVHKKLQGDTIAHLAFLQIRLQPLYSGAGPITDFPELTGRASTSAHQSISLTGR
jgi:hypothetical protein